MLQLSNQPLDLFMLLIQLSLLRSQDVPLLH